MSYKIFISYKYADQDVYPLNGKYDTTVRSYVDVLENYFDKNTDHIYKGESDGEDLSDLSEESIWSKLRDRIYDSSITVVLASPNMRDYYTSEKDQWIAREMSYSLRETVRNDRTSHANGVVLLALPDSSGSYEYIVNHKDCCSATYNIWKTDCLFPIISANLFSRRKMERIPCLNNHAIYRGEPSYIVMAKWADITDGSALKVLLDRAIAIRDSKDEYDVTVELSDA